MIPHRLRPLAAALVGGAALHLAGRGALAPPPLRPDGAARWLGECDAVTAALAIVRLLAFAAACYVTIVLGARAACSGFRAPRLHRAIESITIPAVRRLVASAAGAATLLPAAPALAAPPDSAGAVAVMVRLPDASELEAEATTQERLDATPVDDRWVVEPGDSFWSIASEVVNDQLGDAASDDVTAGYWRRLIDANRDRLIVPTDPNLLRPGQELVIPPV